MTTYDRISRLNHWLTALLFVAMLGFGYFLAYGGLALPEKLPLLNNHKAMGVLLLILALWRVGYRMIQGFAEPVGALPAWQERASTVSHKVLLACVLLMPVSGLTLAVFSGIPTNVFGLFTIPAVEKVDAMVIGARMAHKIVAYLLTITLAVHIAAALKHHLVDQDRTLLRMLKG
ncbi:cytochrome b [Yoonia sp. SS1-5]|uniref:Cytochrome b n=1 Tax=Yoonia rhodophyticola TaxID=3137370 RepID=A0AAN0MD84_9RHOB